MCKVSPAERDCIHLHDKRAISCRVCGMGPCRVPPLPGPKVYLAARFSDRSKMEDVANLLKTYGFEITARWVYGGEEGLTREQIAILDIDDVDACDTLVSFTQPFGSMNKGGGRHAEFGYALARGKRLVLIGERENVFHHMPSVEVYATVAEWLQAEARR